MSSNTSTNPLSTPLGRWVERGEAQPTPDERYAAEFLLAHERLSGAGYEHYEVSNYARPGKRAVHNTAYWTRAPYLGLGPSAHSASGARRWWNIREWAEWERAIHAGGSTVAGEEFLDATMIQLEDHYLGLRTNLGVQLAGLSGATVALWEGEGWATRAEGRLRLTPEGWLRLDALAATLAGARR